MNKKLLVWSLSAVAVAAAAWLASIAWRGHKGLVTLKVRNAPIAEVVQAIQKQTRKQIKLDAKLEGLVTLNVKNKPLSEVLDRVTQQTGASWTTIYAVYNSPLALRALEAILPGQSNLQEAGWKKVAPGDVRGPGLKDDLGITGNDPLPPGAKMIRETEDVVATGPRTNALRAARQAGVGQLSPGIMVVRKRGDGVVEEEVWSPVELLLEERLVSRLKSDFSGAASYEEAQQAAHEANGLLRVYYAVRKSTLGMGLAGMPRMQRLMSKGAGLAGSDGISGGTEDRSHKIRMPAQDLEDTLRRQKLEELGRLTPEQRVMQSRERQHSMHP